MTNVTKASGAAIATAAALLFSGLATGTANAAEEAKVHCNGVNACKGQSACKTAKSECKGMNACKGQGFVEMTQKDCDKAKEKMAKGK
jgi:hypothetical protein